MNKFVTKCGKPMRELVRRRLIAVMTNEMNDGLTQKALAKKVHVSVRTLREYSTDELLAEVRMARARGMELRDLHEVDRAMLEKARAGNVGAARLVYARLAGMQDEDEEIPTLEELEREVMKLKEGVNKARG